MTTPYDGGPAFPRPSGPPQKGMDTSAQEGMSLRDYFAGQALSGLCSKPQETAEAAAKLSMSGNEYAAKLAWTLADSMLENRQSQ